MLFDRGDVVVVVGGVVAAVVDGVSSDVSSTTAVE